MSISVKMNSGSFQLSTTYPTKNRWAKTAYKADIFSHLNDLNPKMQEKNDTTPVLLKSIAAHLKMLQERFELYFPLLML